MTFEKFTDEQWQAVYSTRDNWPKGTNWRGAIERIGRDCWEARASRQKWIEKLHGKSPAKQREKIYKTLLSVRHSQKALAAVLKVGLLDDDFAHPDFETPENRLRAWLSEYDLWVQPFGGKNDPIKAELEWRLMQLWKAAGGALRWSRKKDDAGTPYGPLLDFLTLTLDAILGKALQPSGVAKIIVRHREQRRRHDPYLMYAMRQ